MGGNFIGMNTYDPSHVDTSAQWRPKGGLFPYFLSDEEIADNDSEREEYEEGDEIEHDSFKTNFKSKWKQQQTGDFIKGDTQTFGMSVPSMAYEGRNNSMQHRGGISPIVGMYKNIDGPQLGGGGAGQAFKTTGNYVRTGTINGFSKGNIKVKRKKQPEREVGLKAFFDSINEEDNDLLENFFLNNSSIFEF